MLCYDFLQRVGQWLTTTWYVCSLTFCSCNEYVCKHLQGKYGYVLKNFTLTCQQYHGGTNFGRTGASYVLTGYYDEAPMDEYGRSPQLTIRFIHWFLSPSCLLLLRSV